MSEVIAVPVASGLVEFVPGAVGGFFNVFVGHPMDLIKVRQQSSTTTSRRAAVAALNDASVTGMLRHIFAQEGVHGLYRGVTSPLLAVTPAFAISFWSCDLGKRVIRERGNIAPETPLSITQISLAGGFSGVPMACVVGPSERIKCLMQVDKSRFNGILDCAQQVYREGGLRSVFRGTGSAVLRDVPGNAAYFASYEFFKRLFASMEHPQSTFSSTTMSVSTPAILMAGGLAGVANWVVAIPFDVVKSRWQTAAAGQYSSLTDVVRQTVRHEGVSALFRGLAPALLRAFPANAACLLGVETARGFFANNNNSNNQR